MMLKEGFERVRTLVLADVTNGQAGTGTTLPVITDTGLETAVADSNNALSPKTEGADSVSCTHIVALGESNGSTLTEWEVNNGVESYNRAVKAGLAKVAVMEVHHITNFNLTRVY